MLRSYSWSANICGKKRWILYPAGICELYFISDRRVEVVTVNCAGYLCERMSKQIDVHGQLPTYTVCRSNAFAVYVM